MNDISLCKCHPPKRQYPVDYEAPRIWMEVQTEVHISQSLTHFTILYITKVTNFGMWRKGVDRIDQLYILELL